MDSKAVSLVRITTGQLAEGTHPDGELARAVLRKDRKASAEFVNRYSGPVLAYVRARLLPYLEPVEDLVQEVFAAAWQYLPGYKATSPLGAWILGIARHKVEDHYRSRLRQWESWDNEAMEAVEDGAPPMEMKLDRRRMCERTRQVLQALPEHYAAALLWRYWEGRSAREIAEATGRSEKAVERLLARSRDNFRRRWHDA